MSAARIRYQDVIPYDVPRSLAELQGPTTGVLELPHSVHWGPDRRVDLADPDDRVAAYQAVVREGSTAQQEVLLDAMVLKRVWPALSLPDRCRLRWETSFPELAR